MKLNATDKAAALDELEEWVYYGHIGFCFFFQSETLSSRNSQHMVIQIIINKDTAGRTPTSKKIQVKSIIPNDSAYGEGLGGRGSCGAEKGMTV